MELAQKILEQLLLVSVSVSLAIAIALPLGILFKSSPKLQALSLGIASIFQTIPSLALLAMLLPLFGIGMIPAFIALTLYALLPILRNTIIGFQQIRKDYIEAAKSLGANAWQILFKIELPLASPVIIAGIRTAVSMTMGIATIAAFIGAGGLGDYITRGLAMNNNHLLLMGAIPAAMLALLLDGLFAYFQKKPAHSLGLIIIILGLLLFLIPHKSSDNIIRIGTKNFTEQYILGEIIAQRIEANTHLTVERKFNLGTTEICQEALNKSEIDIYPEYTGTAYMTVLHQTKVINSQDLFNTVKTYYDSHYKILWLTPFGFNNSQSLTVPEDLANHYKLKNISDLKNLSSNLILGAPPEFLDRPDGYLVLQKAYHLNFKEVKAMDPGLMYKAIVQHQLDVINAFTTDGRIAAYKLFILKDNLNVFPAYQAAPIIREDILKKYPQLKSLLAISIDNKTMQTLNYEVDVEKKLPALVAHQFLIEHNLIPS